MDAHEYLNAFRRRWAVIAGSVLCAVLAAVAITVFKPPPPLTREYEATTTLLLAGSASGVFTNIDTLAALLEVGDVPANVAKAIQSGGTEVSPESRARLSRLDPTELSAMLSTTAEESTGLLNITATGATTEDAVAVSTLFSDELIHYVSVLQKESVADQTSNLDQQIKDLDVLIDQAGGETSPTAQDLVSQRDQLNKQLSELTASSGLLKVQEPTPKEVFNSTVVGPRSLAQRVGLAAVIGLMAGLALALVLERLDTTIRTRADAEKGYGVPVLAEIPRLGRRDRRAIVAVDEPRSAPTEAFRLLGAELVRQLVEGRVSNPSKPDEHARVIVITSAEPGDGKTTVTANLAVVLADGGKNVLAMSCDLRRPRLHELFGLSNEHGLSDGLASSEGHATLNGNAQAAARDVTLVASGPPPDRPAELLASEGMSRLMDDVRDQADLVVMDTSPILTVSDVAPLLAGADAVLVVARSGKTQTEQAQRTVEVLGRLGASIVGVVLNDAEIRGRRTYNSYYYQQPRDERRRGFPHLFRRSRKK